MSKDERQLHNPPADEAAFSLEDILAEYGKGGRQPAPEPVVTPSAVIPEAPPVVAPPAAAAPPTEAEVLRIDLPQKQKAKHKKKRKKHDTAEFPVVHTSEEPLAAPPAQEPDRMGAPGAPAGEELPPDRVSLKNVMFDTVDAVLAENEDGILSPPPTLRQRLHGLLRGGAERRRRAQDTEQLWQEAEEKPRRAPPPPPEPDSDEAFRAEKRRVKHLHRGLTLLSVPAAALAILAALDTLGLLPAVWWENAWLRSGVPGGCLLLAALLAMDVWRSAVNEIRKKHVTGELGALLLTLVILASCLADGVTGRTDRPPFAAAAAALMWVQLWAMLLRAETRREAFQLVNVGGEPPYVASCTDAGICKQKGRLAGFYRLSDQSDPVRRWEWCLVPLLLSAATALAAAACLKNQSMDRFLWVWSAHLTVALPLSLPLTAALPLKRLQHRLVRGGSALAGYAGAPPLSRSRQLLVTENDLFPTGTVAFNGYKVYGEERVKMLSYAAGMAQEAHSQLTALFRQQLAAEGGFSARVDDLRFCEEGGVIGTIRGETVAMGSAYFMRKQRIPLPHDLKLQTGVFLAVDGVLGAIFVIKYQPSRNVEWSLRALRRARMRPVLAVRSGNVTPGLLKRKFSVDCRPLYPNVSARLALSDVMEQRGKQPCAVIYREGLMPLAEAVIGSRRLRSAARTGTCLCDLGAVLGLLLTHYLTSVGSYTTLLPLYMLGFMALWLLPTLLLSGLVKHF